MDQIPLEGRGSLGMRFPLPSPLPPRNLTCKPGWLYLYKDTDLQTWLVWGVSSVGPFILPAFFIKKKKRERDGSKLWTSLQVDLLNYLLANVQQWIILCLAHVFYYKNILCIGRDPQSYIVWHVLYRIPIILSPNTLEWSTKV